MSDMALPADGETLVAGRIFIIAAAGMALAAIAVAGEREGRGDAVAGEREGRGDAVAGEATCVVLDLCLCLILRLLAPLPDEEAGPPRDEVSLAPVRAEPDGEGSSSSAASRRGGTTNGREPVEGCSGAEDVRSCPEGDSM